MSDVTLYCGDCLDVLEGIEDQCIDAMITSPPYYKKLRYESKGELGDEATPQEYCRSLSLRFLQCYRVLVDGGTFWLNIADTYNNYSPIRKAISEKKSKEAPSYKSRRRLIVGYREKELLGIPFMVKDTLRNIGFVWRSLNIWAKPTSSYDSAQDRPTLSHEYVFQFVKAKGNGRPYANSKRIEGSVWTFPPVSVEGCPCSFPLDLPLTICQSIKGETILDPFMGSGQTGIACLLTGFNFVGIEKKRDTFEVASKRIKENQERLTQLELV
jgi:DNA modification methylase